MGKAKIAITPEIQIRPSAWVSEMGELRGYQLTVPISKFLYGVTIFPLHMLKQQRLKLLGDTGVSFLRNLSTCKGISRIEIHPHLIRVWKSYGYDWDYVEKTILDSIREAYRESGLGEAKLVNWSGTISG